MWGISSSLMHLVKVNGQMHIYCPFISPVTVLLALIHKKSSRSVANQWHSWTGRVLMCGVLMEREGGSTSALTLPNSHYNFSEATVVQQLMDWRGWEQLLERQQLDMSEQRSLFRVCWFTCALCTGRGATTIDWICGWQWLMSHSNHFIYFFIYSIIK